MNTLEGRMGRQDLDRAIGHMTRSEILDSLELLMDEGDTGSPTANLVRMRNPNTAVAVKVMLLHATRIRRMQRSSDIRQQLGGSRGLAWLRARLGAALLSKKAPAAETAADGLLDPSLAAHDENADKIAIALKLAFNLCVGRPANESELAAGRAAAMDSGEKNFVRFVRALHDSEESRLFRRSSWTVFTSAASITSSDGQEDLLGEGIVITYQLTVGRTPGMSEIEIWKRNFADGLGFPDFIRVMDGSDEAKAHKKTNLAHFWDGRFIQLLYESVLGYGAGARDIATWQRELSLGNVNREDILKSLFKRYALVFAAESEMQMGNVHDSRKCSLAGTGKFLTPEIWDARAHELAEQEPRSVPLTEAVHFYIKAKPAVLVTAIASLYRGGDFIEQFMDNICSQSCFRDYCELIIVDAESPENEAEVIARYMKSYPNIVYQRMNYRIGIYDAWNVGVKLARGAYLTNTNMDDLRRVDSLEIQAGTLDSLPFVDVVYQDFYYTLDPRMTFAQIAAMGFKSNVPLVTSMNMMDFNSPHNAPMWRKRLHDEVGYFDTSFKSAGDYDFWMRCVLQNKVFYKTNDPHVVYYQNPDGISTRPDTRGVLEGRRILSTYARRLVPDNVVMPMKEFLKLSQFMPDPALVEELGRHACAQRALRNVAIKTKYPSAVEGAIC